MNSDDMKVHKRALDHSDPAVVAFLTLIEQDISAGNFSSLPEDLEGRMMAAAAQIVDLDEIIEGDVTL